VQTPTLSVVVEREELIRKFISRDYWEIHASFAAQAGAYAGKWFNPTHKANADDKEIKEDRVWSLAEAQAIADAVRHQTATVTEESKPSSKGSPGLFDLTTLQREANGRFGFSAKTTLSLAQSLYERHKALTYPRTDFQAPARGLPAHGQETMQMLAKQWHGPFGTLRQNRHRPGLHQAQQEGV
jgi:DNA topoisomerase-3